MNPVPFDIYAVASTISDGELVVMPTDTIFGVVADAKNKAAVTKLREVKKRDLSKGCIVLCAFPDQVEDFGVDPDIIEKVQQYWSTPTSIVLPVAEGCGYLHGDLEGVAFRMVNDGELHELLAAVGPIAAPSANPNGLPPAKTAQEAIDYFGDQVALYIDGPVLSTKPSRVMRVDADGEITVIRD